EVALEVEAAGQERLARIEVARGDPQEVGHAQLQRQERRGRGALADGCLLRGDANAPLRTTPVGASEVVLDLAGATARGPGLVGLRHDAEDQLQPARRADGALEAGIARAAHERLERLLAAVLREALQRPEARAGERAMAVVRRRGDRGPGCSRRNPVVTLGDP